MKKNVKKFVALALMLLTLCITPTTCFLTDAYAASNLPKHKSGYYTYTVENGEATIVDCDTSIAGNQAIPSELDGYPVTAIGDSAFSCCDNLKNIQIPNTVTRIGEDAFRYAWYYDEMDEWEDGVLYIGNYLIDAHKEFVAGDYEVKKGTIAIADNAFSFCGFVTSVKLPGSLKTIGNYSFTNCKNVTSINIPSSVNYIGDYAFFQCKSLESIVIPNGVTTIPHLAFDSCTSLKSVTIPLSVTRIDYCAFNMCLDLTDIYYEGSEADWQNISIDRNYCEALTYATKHFNSPMPEYDDDSFSSFESSSDYEHITEFVPDYSYVEETENYTYFGGDTYTYYNDGDEYYYEDEYYEDDEYYAIGKAAEETEPLEWWVWLLIGLGVVGIFGFAFVIIIIVVIVVIVKKKKKKNINAR